VGTILVYSVMQIEQQELKKERKRGEGKHAYSVMKNNLNKSLREKEVEKKNIYKCKIDRATTTLAASTSYVRFQNGLSKAIVSTVPFRSIRQSRVTGPSVLSKIGPCHASPRPVSNRSNV
jgi:hypothetical protein